ncbi:hypothetical protein CR513_03557, partial [Mucuna pruriens]
MGTKLQFWVKQGYPIQAKAPNIQSLHYWGSCLKGQWHRAFERKHGNLLRILDIETQPEALEALMAKAKRNRNRLAGLPRVYLEQRLCQLREEEEWTAVMDVFRLLLYGILLFPQVEDYVDLATMEVFMAKKDRGENPTMAVLANTYYTFNYCSEQKEGSLRCCTPLLYLWLMSHLFHYKSKTACPIEEFKWSWIWTMTKESWIKQLNEASERTIRWYPPWNEREHMIVKCEGYPNRTRSCGTSPSYRAWLENRVKLVGLPWGRIQHQDREAQSYEVQETLKIGELEGALEQMKAEQKDLKRRLETAMEEVHQERQLKDETTKRAQAERETRLKVGSFLRAEDKEMCSKRVERDQLAIEKEQLEEALLNAKMREAEQGEQFH